MGNEVLNVFQLTIFLKKEIFFEKTVKNNLEKVSSYRKNEYLVIFFITNQMLNIFSFKKKAVFPEKTARKFSEGHLNIF